MSQDVEIVSGLQMDLDLSDDIDLNFDTDPIQEYLQRKLEEIQHANKKLEEQLSDKKKLLAECLETSSETSSPSLEIAEVWTKIHNHRFIIGVNLRNCAEKGSITVKDVILNWNSPNSIMYKRKIFQFEETANLDVLTTFPLESDSVQANSILILAIDKPDFTNQLCYDINGIIIYSEASPETKTDEKQIGLPMVKVEIKDFLDNSLKVDTYQELYKWITKGVLSCIVGQDEFYLVARALDDPDLDKNLSVLCQYVELDWISKRKMFLIMNICDNIDGSLIQVSAREDAEIFDLKIMCSNQDCLFQILHHMYNRIPGLCILPTTHEIFLHQLNSSQDTLEGDRGVNKERFAAALRKQLEFIHEFCSGKVSQCGRENYHKFRKELNQLQYETDVAYLKCSVFDV